MAAPQDIPSGHQLAGLVDQTTDFWQLSEPLQLWMALQSFLGLHLFLLYQLPLASVLPLAHVYVNTAEILLDLMRDSFVMQAVLHPLLGVGQTLSHEWCHFLGLVERVALLAYLRVLEQYFEEIVVVIVDCVVGRLNYVGLFQNVVELPSVRLIRGLELVDVSSKVMRLLLWLLISHIPPVFSLVTELVAIEVVNFPVLLGQFDL